MRKRACNTLLSRKRYTGERPITKEGKRGRDWACGTHKIEKGRRKKPTTELLTKLALKTTVAACTHVVRNGAPLTAQREKTTVGLRRKGHATDKLLKKKKKIKKTVVGGDGASIGQERRKKMKI